jgi:GNAT superfamily N-acetyltransferase
VGQFDVRQALACRNLGDKLKFVGHLSVVEFRLANQKDAARITGLHAASWRDTYRGLLSDEYLDGDLVAERAKIWVERLTTPNPKQRIVLAEADRGLAGFACAFGSDDPELGTLLDNLHVSREFQRQGIGAKLMLEIASWCQDELPGEGLFLWVLEGNRQARQFYEQLGAIKVNEDFWHAPDGRLIPGLCYAWKRMDSLLSALTIRTSKP